MADQQTEKRPRVSLLSNPRPGFDLAMAGATQAALDEAVAVARGGDRQRAREICAAVVLDAQPIIAARADLLRGTFYALLMAHGFRLLSRVVLALTGRSVQVGLLPECNGPIAPPAMREQPGRTICTLDPRWLDRLSLDDMLLRHWCDALLARPPGPAAASGTAPVSRHLEPA